MYCDNFVRIHLLLPWSTGLTYWSTWQSWGDVNDQKYMTRNLKFFCTLHHVTLFSSVNYKTFTRKLTDLTPFITEVRNSIVYKLEQQCSLDL